MYLDSESVLSNSDPIIMDRLIEWNNIIGGKLKKKSKKKLKRKSKKK